MLHSCRCNIDLSSLSRCLVLSPLQGNPQKDASNGSDSAFYLVDPSSPPLPALEVTASSTADQANAWNASPTALGNAWGDSTTSTENATSNNPGATIPTLASQSLQMYGEIMLPTVLLLKALVSGMTRSQRHLSITPTEVQEM
jgi:hypothetical protein